MKRKSLCVLMIVGFVILSAYVISISPITTPLIEATKTTTETQKTFLEKLQNAGSHEKERKVVLEFVDLYRYSYDSQYTLGEALVIFLSKSQSLYPDLTIIEKTYNPRERGEGIKNEYYWNDYNLEFRLENFRGETVEIEFSINPINEKITHVYNKFELAGWLLQDPHYTLYRDNIQDITLEQFLGTL